jgi:uncharacterized membrane protein
MLLRVFYASCVGLIGALVAHLVIIFLLPVVSTTTAWAYVQNNLEIGQLTEITGTEGINAIAGIDPASRALICSFDLADGAMTITASGASPFWSVSVHNSRGDILFSANDRIVSNGQLDLAVANDQQIRAIRQQLPDELAQSIIVNAKDNAGFVMLRILQPDESWKPVSDALIEGSACQYLVL